MIEFPSNPESSHDHITLSTSNLGGDLSIYGVNKYWSGVSNGEGSFGNAGNMDFVTYRYYEALDNLDQSVEYNEGTFSITVKGGRASG